MKKIVYILTAVLAFAACAPEEIHHPTEAEAPQTASAYEPVISVDQEINQVTFSVDAKGVIPVWLLPNGAGEFVEYHAQNGFRKIFTNAGDYKVRMKVMNAAGVTPDYVEKTFHIDNTIASFDRYITFLAGGTSADNTKNWRIDGDVEGHMGCGEPGTAGTNWWSAVPGDKAAFGVYEDLLTFTGDGVYTYDPGEDGATYVNIDGVTVSPFIEQKGDATADYNASVSAQTTTYAFSFRGNDLYLTFPEHTLFPYIDNDDFWADPSFLVLNLTRETMELVHDNGNIAWHFTLTSKAAAYVFNGFKYNAESNLWRPADAAHTYNYYYAPGWNPIADPETVQEGGEYTLTLSAGTSDQWQAQFFIIPDTPVVLTADKNYDFSVIVNSNTTIPNMTFKLTDVNDDGNFLFTERETVEGGKQHIFYRSDLAGIDAPNGVKMVFDFGGNPDGTVVSIANIVVKDHAIDDGTILPGDEPGTDEPESGAHFDITGSTNFWRSMSYTMSFYTAHGNDWAGLPDSGFTADDANYVYTISMPEATDNQWQRQVAFHTTMSSEAGKNYDFCCTLTPTMDLPGVTFKLVLDGGGDNDSVFYFEERHDLAAFEPFEFRKPDMPGIDMNAIALFFDFGGNPAGAEVEIKDVCFQEHQAPQGGSGHSYGDNVWTGAYLKETWFSAADWNGGLDPQASYENGVLSLTVPEGIGGSEWQGQVKLVADIPADPAKQYAFFANVESTSDGVCTIKVADANDDSAHDFFYDGNVPLAAYEVVSYKNEPVAPDQAYEAVMVIFDFGRLPAGTEIAVSGIELREITGSAGGSGTVAPFDYDSADNLWKPVDAADGHTFSQFYAPGWNPLADRDVTHSGSSYSFTYPEATFERWQAQFFIIPAEAAAVSLSADKTYDFQAKVELSQDVKGVTFKLTDTTDDGNFLFDKQSDIPAYDEFVFELVGLTGIDAAAVKMVFDFGGCPADTEVIIKDIIVREHK